MVYCKQYRKRSLHRMKTNSKKQSLLLLLGSAALLAVLALFAWGVSRSLAQNQSASKFPIQIQEYMASNTLYPNENGVCADWVELYNASDADIPIGGFKLTDQSRKARYTVPAGTVLPARGFYVIYCLRSAGEQYADFGLARSGGEEILLLNRKNVLIDAVETISLPENASAERGADGLFYVSLNPSPGAPAIDAPVQDETDVEEALRDVPGHIVLSEIIPGNTLYADANGVVCDLVELANTGDAAVELGGYVLQNGVDGERFTVPDGVALAPGQRYLIPCARAQGSDQYADFALSRSGGELLLLYAPDGVLTDHIATLPCGKNESIVRENGRPVVLSYATPGYPNTEAGYYDCLAAHTQQAPVRIAEIMTANASCYFPDGTAPDWVELCNATDAAFDLSGCGLSDGAASVRYTFPDGTTLPAGGYMVIPCDGNAGRADGAAHFGLSAAGGETVLLTAPDGTLLSAAVTVRADTDTALVYAFSVLPAMSEHPTPGYPNDENGLAAYRAAQIGTADLMITEIMPRNACTVAAKNGSFADWIELYNGGSAALTLSDFCLSDRKDDPTRFPLPDVTLAPGEYALVFCDKAAGGDAAELWVPFGLSGKGGMVTLSSRTGSVFDRVEYPDAEKDRSFRRADDGTFAVTDYPTPGYPNTATGYTSFSKAWSPAGLYIAEVMPSNRSYARTGGQYYDWIELCNGSDGPIALQNYCLTDDNTLPDKYVLPNVTLQSGGRILIYCSGDASLTGKNAYHCPFRLNGGEDCVYLYAKDGTLCDYLHVYKVPPEGSIGRKDRTGGPYLFTTPTPNARNTGGVFAAQTSDAPIADKTSGIYDGAGSVVVTLSAPGTIYYTTDGSAPTERSAVCSGPLRIAKTTVLRAAALEPNKRLSDVITLAYTLNEGHTLPVLHLAIAPEDFSGSRGIYSHPQERWQRAGSIVYTDANGTVAHDCGVRISGQHSRTRPQKSFKLLFTGEYGGRLCYDIFGEDCEFNSFPALLLRAGLDSKYGLYREPLAQQPAMPYRDTTFVQDSLPIVVYVNGEYYGIYQFMEALNEETLADRLDVRTDSITLFKGYMYPEHRNYEIYQLMQYVQTHDMKNPEYYAYAKAHLAFEDLIDWGIFEAYCYNDDLSANVRYFNSTQDDGRWHFVYYDVECGFKAPASFEQVFKSGQTAIFFKALLQNAEFKDMFLKRLAYHCAHTFRQEDMLALLYAYDDAVREESVRHFKRWGLQPITYVYNFNQMERLLKADRVQQLKTSAQKLLGMSSVAFNAYFAG